MTAHCDTCKMPLPHNCDTCHQDNGCLRVYALPGVPLSVANCMVCLQTDCYPWGVLIGNTAQIGGLEHAADWWKAAVQRSLARLGRTYEELLTEVAELRRDLEAAGL